jgi:hypothetical protein
VEAIRQRLVERTRQLVERTRRLVERTQPRQVERTARQVERTLRLVEAIRRLDMRRLPPVTRRRLAGATWEVILPQGPGTSA